MAIVEVNTEITGNVWKVLLSAGDDVVEDEAIIILESMKMEIPVSAPQSRKLNEILVSEGQMFLEGAVVAWIEAWKCVPMKPLDANSGEIARRIIGTCKILEIPTAAVHSEADAGLPHEVSAGTGRRMRRHQSDRGSGCGISGCS